MNRKWVVRQNKEHRYVSGRLSAYLDRRVSDREYRRVKTHLETCEQCQQELETLLWTKKLLRQAPVMPVPRSFVVRQADVVPARRAPRRTLFAMQWATAVVALLFVVVLFGDALIGPRMMTGSMQPTSEAMLAVPVAMEQADQKAAETAEVVDIDQETEAEHVMALETDQGEAGVTPPVKEQARAMVREDESQAPKLGAAAGSLTATVVSESAAAPVEEVAPSAVPTTYPETQLMAAPPAPKSDEPEVLAAQAEGMSTEPSLQQSSEPTRGGQESSTRVIWRSVEIGLGVALIGLIVVVALLRRRL